jgi:hypothetical protein
LKLESTIFLKIKKEKKSQLFPNNFEFKDIVENIEETKLCSGPNILKDDKVFAGIDRSSEFVNEKELIGS